MDARPLEQWLKRKPKPKRLRLTVSGAVRDMLLSPGQTWLPVAESVLALSPELVEALDNEGKFLRAVNPEELDELGEAITPATPRRTTPTRAVIEPPDAESARYMFVAQLLADAYRHSTDVAFERMVDLFEASNLRQESTERALDHLTKLLRRTVEQQLKDGQVVEAESTDDEKEILRLLAGKLMNGSAAKEA